MMPSRESRRRRLLYAYVSFLSMAAPTLFAASGLGARHMLGPTVSLNLRLWSRLCRRLISQTRTHVATSLCGEQWTPKVPVPSSSELETQVESEGSESKDEKETGKKRGETIPLDLMNTSIVF